MIYVDRNSVQVPESLSGSAARKAKEFAIQFYRQPPEVRRQERHRFDQKIYASSSVKNTLLALFHGKCAYCESRLAVVGYGDIEHFRPKMGAVGINKDYSEDHYWWLAYEWQNILISCQYCNRTKAARFPVLGRRADVEDDLRAEAALLLDPTDPRDDPSTHLSFSRDGLVTGLTNRGTVTVDVLTLNRNSLVEARRICAERLLQTLKLSGTSTGFDLVMKELSAEVEYLALTRQLVRGWRDKLDRQIKVPEEIQEQLKRTQPLSLAMKSPNNVVTHVAGIQLPQQMAPSIIESVSIRNFRGIADLTLNLTEIEKPNVQIDDDELKSGSWLMLIGENGRGKSTILQAIALTLSTTEEIRSLKLNARSFLRHGSEEGFITVRLVGRREELTLVIMPDSPDFAGVRPTEPIAMLGYGATRLLPRGRTQSPSRSSRVANLFDPFVALADAEQWLLSLKPVHFAYAARALKDLLADVQRDLFFDVEPQNQPERVVVHVGRHRLSLDQLSDGYQSVVALATDIMRGLSREFKGGLEAAEGIVLLDEIGAQLHPRWKMKIVSSLRATFPRLQFIATSHDPLCLRGLKNGEVAVLRRTARGRVFLVEELPPAEGLRVDQLLTSEFFGLNSTLDPSIEAEFEEFYRLKAKRNPTTLESTRMQELDRKLTPIDIPGTSRRERLLLRAIDSYLARENETPTTKGRAKLRREADAAIAVILNRTVGNKR